MLEKYRNPVAETLRAGGRVSAAWLQSGSPIAAEVLAQAGFDVLLVDLEHGHINDVGLIQQIQAMKGEPAVPFVRVPWNDAVAIKRVLDAGAYGLVVPYVSTRAEAEAAVSAAKYPPEGVRGVAGSTRAARYGDNPAEYFRSANREICVFVQIETPDGVRNLDEILQVDGVDGIFIGPMDLATTHGFLANPHAAEIVRILGEVEAKIRASGRWMATISFGFEDAKAKFERGFGMVTLLSDIAALGQVARAEVARFKAEVLAG